MERLKNEDEIRRRLCEGLSGPTFSVVFESTLVDFEAVRNVLLKNNAGDLVENRILEVNLFEERSYSILIIKLRERDCIASCEQRCGNRDSQCFGECFFRCLAYEKSEAEEKLCR
ncbi:MAG: hypothetical protein ACP5I2_04595 [Fervidicoccaceae archaeon]